MTNLSAKIAELFVMKGAAIRADLDAVSDTQELVRAKSDVESATDALIKPHLDQVDFSIRSASVRMAEFYQIFYVLENDIRVFVSDILEVAHGKNWWEKVVPPNVRDYAAKNKEKESKEGLPPRSQKYVDYTSFGQLGQIIKENWIDFAGLFPNCETERLEKVIQRLNLARGPIAHCGYLPEDEVVRLKLAIRDWYSLFE